MNAKEIRANRNRLSAVRSREKKFEMRDSLLLELNRLQAQNDILRKENEHSRQVLMRWNPYYDPSWGRPLDSSVFSPEPAVEEGSDCQRISSQEMSECMDNASQTSSSSSSTDELSIKRERRMYRSQYLRCKRLRSKGFKVALPAKSWQVTESFATSSVAEVLSKDDLRRIKNRESAERSRKAITDSICEAERCISLARQQNFALQAENGYLMQQLAQIVSQGQNIHYVLNQDISPSKQASLDSSISWCELDSGDMCSIVSDSLSDLTETSSVLQEILSPPIDIDFDMTLSDEALDLLFDNLC